MLPQKREVKGGDCQLIDNKFLAEKSRYGVYKNLTFSVRNYTCTVQDKATIRHLLWLCLSKIDDTSFDYLILSEKKSFCITFIFCT